MRQWIRHSSCNSLFVNAWFQEPSTAWFKDRLYARTFLQTINMVIINSGSLIIVRNDRTDCYLEHSIRVLLYICNSQVASSGNKLDTNISFCKSGQFAPCVSLADCCSIHELLCWRSTLVRQFSSCTMLAAVLAGTRTVLNPDWPTPLESPIS